MTGDTNAPGTSSLSGPSLTEWLDDRRVEAILDSMTDDQRAAEILAFIAERRRHVQRDLLELANSLDSARTGHDSLIEECDALRARVTELEDRLRYAESEAAGLRDSQHEGGLVTQAVRRAVVAGRAAKRTLR